MAIRARKLGTAYNFAPARFNFQDGNGTTNTKTKARRVVLGHISGNNDKVWDSDQKTGGLKPSTPKRSAAPTRPTPHQTPQTSARAPVLAHLAPAVPQPRPVVIAHKVVPGEPDAALVEVHAELFEAEVKLRSERSARCVRGT